MIFVCWVIFYFLFTSQAQGDSQGWGEEDRTRREPEINSNLHSELVSEIQGHMVHPNYML